MPEPTRTLFKPEPWPAGHRSALAILVDLDPPETPWTLPSRHASEAAAARLLGMMADLDITPTVIIDPEAVDQYSLPPDTRHDTAIHRPTTPAGLATATSACESRLGTPPRGIVARPGQSTDPPDDPDLWIMDGSGAPFPETTPEGRVVIPYNGYWHDVTWLATAHPSPPSAFLEHISLSLASIRTRGELMTLYLTAQIAGHPGHLETTQRFLDEAIGAGDVWITNGSGIAEFASTTPNG